MILKICGVTNQEDATAAVAAGANAIGFNFYQRSPRYITPENAAAIFTGPGVRRVGVFVNESRAGMENVARIAALTGVQLHGDEAIGDYPEHARVWKAFRVAAGFEVTEHDKLPGEALLLDGPAGNFYGGAGLMFDWRLARGSAKPIIIAGGLDASNVGYAIELAEPWGVDACSRIESSPGKKDHKKMQEFLRAARAALQS